MHLKLIFAAALIIIAHVTINAQNNNKDEAALKAVLQDMSEAQSRYDASRLDRIFTADYIEISPIGEFDPRAKVLTFYTPEAKAKDGVELKTTHDYRSIRVYGSTAVVIAELSFVMTKDGNTMPPRKMVMTAVCRKERGTWKVASAQYTGVRPPATKPQ